MLDPNLQELRIQIEEVEASGKQTTGGGGNTFSPSWDLEDIKETAGAVLILAVLSLVLGHAIISGEWFLVKAVAFGVIAGMVLGILYAMAKAVIAFTLEHYDDIKTVLIGIPALALPVILFFAGVSQGEPVLVSAIQAVMMLAFIAVIGQFAFWLLEKFAEHWEGFVLIIIGFLILMALSWFSPMSHSERNTKMPFDIMAFFDGLGLILQATPSAEKSNEGEQVSKTEAESHMDRDEDKKERERILDARRKQMREKRRQRSRSQNRQHQRW